MQNIKNIALPMLGCLLATQLTACGGGSGTASSTIPDEPIQITSASWKKGVKTVVAANSEIIVSRMSKRKLVGRHNLITINNYIRFQVEAQTPNPSTKHHQFFIDIDNNPDTGYQFEGGMWSSKSGADYLLEDNDLYKATSNDSSWSWEWVTTAKHFGKFLGSIELDAKDVKSGYIQPLCNNLNVGYVARDENWQIVEFSPQSNSLQEKTIDYCDHLADAVPTISLIGSSVLRVVLNDPNYADPGVLAKDREDGDLTSQVVVTSNNVNISEVGEYHIRYEVFDSTGNKATAVRTVKVINTPATIVIDNSGSEWQASDRLYYFHKSDRFTRKTSSLSMTDSESYLYFYAYKSFSNPVGGGSALAKNWQLYIDSDNDPSTGYSDAGYDYLIENGVLNKFVGNTSSAWAWNDNVTEDGVISSPRLPNKNSYGSVEAAIDKSLMAGWSQDINVKFLSLNDDWEIVSVMKPTTAYSQLYPQ